ncbi:SdrD B-like domain-containing protein [Fibrella forsythiae]|uniref:DUF11 domain-containing protein n=1 Tax=Fibrella forsythiae TaxID=2817061 RepID=A0ABS3JVD8_9BACT|nr:SdrD B-like domain-containing protein [Fibrella forsythiae]MBO0953144.1 DUF11 domain-containing protein [Fibrella forsythiae]
MKNKYRLPICIPRRPGHSLMGWLSLCLLLIGALRPTQLQAQLLKKGYVLFSCAPNTLNLPGVAPDQTTLAVLDVRQLGTQYANGNFNQDVSSQVPHIKMWQSNTDFGGDWIFGVAVDSRNATMYAANSTLLNRGQTEEDRSVRMQDFAPFPAVPKIYKLDPVTGAITGTCVLNSASKLGVGYITLDEVHNQLFATDLDNGLIYRIRTSDMSIIDTYDPGATGEASDGNVPAFGEGILGVAYNPVENRLYYSVINNLTTGIQRQYPTSGETGQKNTIRSVGLTATGSVDASTDQLDIALSFVYQAVGGEPGTNLSAPAGHIVFDQAGSRMLIAELPLSLAGPHPGNAAGNREYYSAVHFGRVLSARKTGGSWTVEYGAEDTYGNPRGRYFIGGVAGQNSRGGVAWGYGSYTPDNLVDDEAYYLASGDLLRIDFDTQTFIYGLQFGRIDSPDGRPANQNVLVDMDGVTGALAFNAKYLAGIPVVYRGPSCLLPTQASITTQPATCLTGSASASSNASVTVTNVTNADRAFLISGGAGVPLYTDAGSQPVTGSTITFTGLPNPVTSGGTSYSVVFYNGPDCFTIINATLPQTICLPCSLSAVARAGACDPATNTYSSFVELTLLNPIDGVITVTDGAQSLTLATTTSTTTMTAVFTGLISTGANRTITVNLPSCGTTTTSYIAPSSCSVFDLALRKTLAASQPLSVTAGQAVTFTLAVFNQGTLPATAIQLVDYIPTGLTLNDPNWSQVGSTAVLNTPIASLPAGTSMTYNITFQVNSGITGSLVNRAEISAASGGTDVDSTPDNNPNNDAGGQENSGSDDAISGNGTGTVGSTDGATDEDDSDPAVITVVAPVCSLNATASAGSCVPATNTYSASVAVTLSNNPAGTLTVSLPGSAPVSQVVSANAGLVTLVLAGLPSDGLLHTATISLAGCGSTTAPLIAPASCSVAPACGLALVVTPGLCLSASNTYVLSGSITATNLPTSGTLTISSAALAADRTLILPAGSASGSFSYSGLASNGQLYTLTARFSDAACAPVSQSYTAPLSCSVAPICSLSATATAGLCASATNTYSASVVVNLTNAPAGTITVSVPGLAPITQALAANTGSFTAVFAGLPSDGLTRQASISLAGCNSTTATFTAPLSCSVAPVCSLVTSVTAGLCASASNTYSATAVVQVINPAAGTLSVSLGGATQTFVLTGATQNTITAVFQGLPSDGTTRTVTASLAGCGSSLATYVAPASCSVTPACSLSAVAIAGLCEPTTNSFSSTVVVTVVNPGSNQILTISDGTSSQPFTTTGGSANTFTMVFTGLPANGTPRQVSATLPGCSTVNASYTAPASCSVAPLCAISAIATAGVCVAATNTYSTTAVITVQNPAAAGTLLVTTGGRTMSFSTTALSQNTFTAIFTGLVSDGATHLVTVSLPGCSTTSTAYQAPTSCSVVATASLGNYVFEDVNKNGLQDGGDLPIPGALVTLLQGGTLVASTTTDGSGIYSFTGLTPGLPYSVSFTTPTGFSVATAANVGTNDAVDSDPVGGVTAPVTLTAGENNLTLDAGFIRAAVPPITYAISKTVDQRQVELGSLVTYTISLTNTSPTTATNVVVTDTFSGSALTVVGSATASSGSFVATSTGGGWSIPVLAGGQVATLRFQARVGEEGLAYNVVTAPDGTSASACLTVPFHVCANSEFEIVLEAPASFGRYQWLLNDQPIPGATSSTYSVTAIGRYSVATTSASGCPDGSCCPFVVVADPVPSLTAVGVAASCNGATPLNDARITLVASTTSAVSYNITPGSSFTAATPLFASNQPLAAVVGGVLLAGQANAEVAPGRSYTIRVYSAQGCYSDTIVVIPPAQCQCPAVKCTPFTVRKVARR